MLLACAFIYYLHLYAYYKEERYTKIKITSNCSALTLFIRIYVKFDHHRLQTTITTRFSYMKKYTINPQRKNSAHYYIKYMYVYIINLYVLLVSHIMYETKNRTMYTKVIRARSTRKKKKKTNRFLCHPFFFEFTLGMIFLFFKISVLEIFCDRDKE